VGIISCTLPADHHMAWDEFCVAFCGHNLSAGTIRRRLVEFLELCQGNLSIITLHSTEGIMWTVMLRRLSSTIRGSIFSCRTT
jgi:hypothetical protein